MKRIVTDERYEEKDSERSWACVTLAVILLGPGLYCLVNRLMEPVWLYAGVMIPCACITAGRAGGCTTGGW